MSRAWWFIAFACPASAFVPYWRDPRIHNLGNQGLGGAIHSLLAPLSTHIIDRTAYGGRDVRAAILAAYIPVDWSAVDLCCGVGFSTAQVGVDTSVQMVRVARAGACDAEARGALPKRFEVGNAETWGDIDCADVVTLMFALHEMPREGRRAVLTNALRLARRRVVVADICLDYAPSPLMLTGEPFMLDYLSHADEDVRSCAADTGDWDVRVDTEGGGRVAVWVLERTAASDSLPAE
jgi:SAM-dependent methyltransferase